MAQELDIPPNAFFADILGAIVGHIVPAVHGLDTVAPVTLKPTSPDHLPRLAPAVTPECVSVYPSRPGFCSSA